MATCEFIYSNLRRKCNNKSGYNFTCYCRLHWKAVDSSSKIGKEQIKRIQRINSIRETRKKLGLE
jgi:hypothetical protein